MISFAFVCSMSLMQLMRFFKQRCSLRDHTTVWVTLLMYCSLGKTFDIPLAIFAHDTYNFGYKAASST
jgi:hypothetical protein